MFNWVGNITPSLVIFIGAMIAGLGALWAAHQQAGFEKDLRERSDEIARLNRELANSVIGGESFCYLSLSRPDETNTGLLAVIHQGEHNLYDVRARISDLEKSDQFKANFSFATMQLVDTNLSIGNLIPSRASLLGPLTLGDGDTRRFNIFFTARNGTFIQLLRFKRVNGTWAQATKVLREPENEVIFEKIGDEFPRNAEGHVEW